MSDSTTRYRKEEFQDNNGNVIYPHSHASVLWMDDGEQEGSLEEFWKPRVTDEEITAALID